MAELDFYGPDLKVERAEHHINELDRIFGAFVRKNTEALYAKAHKNKWRNRPLDIAGEFPRHTATIVGDAAHNLRAALDHAYCILIEHHNHTLTKWTRFHFRNTAKDLRAAIQADINACHGPSDAIRDTIVDDIQPFPDGKGERLYRLHELDITDKHKVLVPTRTEVSLYGITGVMPNGSILLFNDARFCSLGPQHKMKALLHIGAEVQIKMEKNAKAVFNIGFQQGEPFGAENIVHALRDVLILTKSALKLLRAAA